MNNKEQQVLINRGTKRVAIITFIIGLFISIFSLIIGVKAFIICLIMTIINSFIITYLSRLLVIWLYKFKMIQ